MTTRTTVKTVQFTRPFRLGGIDDVQPAGDYEVTTDEEQVGGMNIQCCLTEGSATGRRMAGISGNSREMAKTCGVSGVLTRRLAAAA